ncbi:hypothetical protein TNCT_716991 [Trichonephila clavata]|uniref:Uncharacterized protein n=1 Tax=Trichonephila clavata TaxID=2740835 RepID=A0A8X6H541_TRICU|nr:hypothetical protein TNCT_716991 [Trichonephila clavata]
MLARCPEPESDCTGTRTIDCHTSGLLELKFILSFTDLYLSLTTPPGERKSPPPHRLEYSLLLAEKERAITL